MKSGLLIILILILFCYPALSVIITPASFDIEFVPGKEYDCGFSVRVNQQTDLLIYSRGELNQSIILSNDKIRAVPGEWNSIECKITLPPDIKPGLNKNFVGVVEDVGGKGAVGGIAGVEVTLFIRKPYPGKYLELEKFEANDAKINEDVTFLMEVINRGNQDILDVYTTFEIYDGDKKVDQVETDHFEIMDRGEFKSSWKTNTAGRYSVLAKINYDGNLLEEKRNFNVGELILKIINVSSAKVKKGDIAKFDINLQSHWNEIIDDVYLELTVVGQELVSKTESTNIGPWGAKTINGFLETSSLEEGIYPVSVKLNYNNKVEGAESSLEITKGLELPYGTIILIAALVVLLILVMVNLVIFKKKWKKRK